VKSVVCELKTVLTIGILALLIPTNNPALGSATGLIVIPTADTLPAGECVIEPGVNGPTDGSGENNYLLGTEFGIFDNLEADVDYDFSRGVERRMLFNTKYVLCLSSKYGLRGGIGIDNVSAGLRAKPYVVLTWRPSGRFGTHAGVFDLVEDCRWFCGVDCSPLARFTLMADYTSGIENLSSFGFFYQLTHRVGIQAGILIPNSGVDPTYSLLISFSEKYAK